MKKKIAGLILAIAVLCSNSAQADGIMLNAVTSAGASQAVTAAGAQGTYAVDIQIWSSAGSVATVNIECRSYSTAPWYPCQVVTNPDTTGVYYSAPLAFQYRLNVAAYTSGTISGTIVLYK